MEETAATNSIAQFLNTLQTDGVVATGLSLSDVVGKWLATYGLRVLGAILLFLLGKLLAKKLRKLLRQSMERAKMEVAMIGFLSSISYAVMIVFLVIACLGVLKIQTMSLITLLGAAGLAIGLALQGSLSNFAAGVMIIIFKPFKTGDFVNAGGVSGVVEEIEIFTTLLKTPDNQEVIIPNAQITSGTITNVTARDTRRVDLKASCAYDDDLDRVESVLKDVLASESRILAEPTPTIGVLEMADSCIVFAVRPWVKTTDYWDVFFALNKAIKLRFDKEGISIPFPQMDVHLKKDGE